MTIATIQRFLAQARSRPLLTGLSLLLLVAAIALGAWVKSFFSELGKSAATAERPMSVRSPDATVAVEEMAVSIEQITVGSNSASTVVNIIVRNRAAEPMLIRRLRLVAFNSADRLFAMSLLPRETLTLAGRANYTVSERRETIQGLFTASGTPGYSYPFSGTLNGTPGSAQSRFNFQMSTAVNVPARSGINLQVAFPHTLRVTRIDRDGTITLWRRSAPRVDRVWVDPRQFRHVRVELETADGDVPQFTLVQEPQAAPLQLRSRP